MTALPPWVVDRVRVADRRELAARLAEGPPPGHCFVPAGGGTLLGRGATPRRPAVLLDLAALDRVIEHARDDLTVTVEAGVTGRALDAVLALGGQWFPGDPFPPERSTVGGLVGADRRGLLAGGLGSVRDHLLGVTFVDAGGREITAGGRVVKNVAGYDLMKLLVGSLGEVGVLVSATLRLHPRPSCASAVIVAAPAPETRRALAQEGPGWFPTALLRGKTARGEWAGAIFLGAAARVTAQAEAARACLGPGARVLETAGARALLGDLSPRLLPEREATAWGGALPAYLAAADLAAFLPGEGWVADLLAGHLWWFPGSEGLEHLRGARERLREGEGHLHVDVPSGAPAAVEVWGADPGPESTLALALRAALDPREHLASGRLPGGV